MKIFTFFLPQFHEIPENNTWWGEGFTEWTNVKSANSLFRGHQQPKIPLDGNYYNLLSKETVKWQTDLMHQYKIDGMIYYHYYFKGKLLLEKPAENLLEWNDIDQPFFFCWANHSWQRTWEGSKEVLMSMEYGNVNDWEKHFLYLLPFFKDERYEKINNMPLFMIFKTDSDVLQKVFDYFDKRCKEEGFDGICLIESYHGVDYPRDFSSKGNISVTKYVYIREPAFSYHCYLKQIKISIEKVFRVITHRLNRLHIIKKPQVYDGTKLYKIKKQIEPKGDSIIHGAFFEWDNTPRHKDRGYIINPVSKSVFLDYIKSVEQEKYLFVNAWNEWAEGMILEPTENNGYKYLEWIREAKMHNENN